MTAVTAQPATLKPAAQGGVIPESGDRRVLLRGITWETYERILADIGDQAGIQLTYDDGLLEIFMPGKKHERVKKILARLIEAYSDEAGIDAEGFGSTTFKSKRRKKGLEPAECYYVQSFGKIAGLDRDFDLETDPPPDLAIEVDITSGSISRESIYAAMGVPEIWRYDGERVAPHVRQPDGTYMKASASAAFPKLDMEQVNQFLAVGLSASQRAAVRALREWVERGA